MSGNTFGHLFRFTTFGESHGAALGCVVDGVPPRIPLAEDDIQVHLDRRRPGGSRYTSQRREADRVKIVAGVFEGRTTGAPIGLIITNEDARSKDYDEIKDKFRPGHADYTYLQKYGVRDHRGGGRASARETAMRVAAGAVARKVLGGGVAIRGALIQMGPHRIDRGRWDWGEVENNPFWCPDPETAKEWETFLDGVRKAGSSTGAVIEVVAAGVPAGLGAPVLDKLDADIAKALIDEGFHPMTIYFPLVVHGAMLIEPTETETRETLDAFIATLRALAAKAKAGETGFFEAAPRHAPRRRLDETRAARQPVLRWRPGSGD